MKTRIRSTTVICVRRDGKVVMAGDVVESYDTSGDPAICSPYLAPAQPVSAQ